MTAIEEFVDGVLVFDSPTYRLPQSKASLTDQMTEMVEAARLLGLYDAQDWVQRFFFDRSVD